ncbi:MAG: GntR family transcriptional regulator [Ornithinimicrobium sp.]|uniref:GntR family transcriptional regulator n=1 Tax=Ornithinimicrobium sp. TaxID=1977084 RepID=UPI003D9BCFEB
MAGELLVDGSQVCLLNADPGPFALGGQERCLGPGNQRLLIPAGGDAQGAGWVEESPGFHVCIRHPLAGRGQMVARKSALPQCGGDHGQVWDSLSGVLLGVPQHPAGSQESIVLACTLAVEPEAAARLDLAPEAKLFALERIRLAGSEPLAHDCVWLPGEIDTPLLHTDFSRTALYDELERHQIPRPDGGRERITATNLSPGQAEHLNVTPGAAALVIERTGLWHGQPIECRRTTVRADRFTLLMSWTSKGYDIQGQTDRSTSTTMPYEALAGTPDANKTMATQPSAQ